MVQGQDGAQVSALGTELTSDQPQAVGTTCVGMELSFRYSRILEESLGGGGRGSRTLVLGPS